MDKFSTLTSSCVPVQIENVDTDQIIPARFLKAISREGFGENLFRDWRYAVRIPNIDKSNLSIVYDAGVFSGSSAHLANLMFEAMYLIPNLSMGRPVFYMSRSIITPLRQQLAAAVQGSTLTASQVGGIFTESFQGIPIRRTDALAADEARVT